MAVSAGAIVKRLDVIEDIGAGQITRFIDAFLDPFLLQATEERLRHGIVPAVAASAHAGFQVVGLQEAQPVITAIL